MKYDKFKKLGLKRFDYVKIDLEDDWIIGRIEKIDINYKKPSSYDFIKLKYSKDKCGNNYFLGAYINEIKRIRVLSK